MKSWVLYLSCGHSKSTFTDPIRDANIWAHYTYCEDCDERKLINKIFPIKIAD